MTKSNVLPRLDDTLCLAEPPLGDAGFGALNTVRGLLPLAALDVRARIDGLLAQMVVRQTFVNVTDEPLEATYIFPLPDRAAVTGFRMEVADRVIDGVLKERGQARRDYDEAIRQGHRATIAEEERPGVFTLRVGNLMPRDRATVELTMAGVLPYVDGDVTFRFPLVVAPRYIPGIPLDGPSVGEGTAVDTDAVPDASRISPPVLLPGFPNPVRLSLAVDLYCLGVAVQDVRVSLHAIFDESSRGDDSPLAEGVHRFILQPGARLDRDFILRFRLGGAGVRTTLSLHPDAGSSLGGDGTLALTIVPPVLAQPEAQRQSSRARDIAFVLDRSGSMQGWKIVAARRAMARMIDTLTDADRFLVLAFDDRIETPTQDQSGLIGATDRNRFCAVEFLAKLESRGGTQIAQPLKLAVDHLTAADGGGDSARRLSRDRVLVLVTDGQVGNEDQVLETIGSRLGGIRVFTLGIDQAVNEGFLRRLAGLGSNGGSCELVESSARLDAVLESIHRRIDAPVMTDVTLEAGRSGLEILADSFVPERPFCLFGGSPLLVLGRYRGQVQAPLRLQARARDGSPYTEELTASVRDNPAIAAAWARGQVRHLEDRYAAGLGDRNALERSLIATSLQFGVLCRFTAYVAVDRAVVVNEGGEVHQIIQPVELPAGWGETLTATGGFVGYAGAMPPQAMAHPMRTMCAPAFASPPSDALFEAAMDLGAGPPRSMTPWAGIVGGSSRGGARRPAPRKTTGGKSPDGPQPLHPALTASELVRQAGYTLLEETERDEYGVVHKARDSRGELVSLRLLKNPFDVGGPKQCLRLEQALRALRHAGIVPVRALVTEPLPAGRVVAVVSEYLSDPSLENWLAQAGPIDALQIARLALALAEALQYAARRGMVHGLLTPARIRIAAQGAPRIEGFGLAALECRPILSDGRTWAYAAPEQKHASAPPRSERADIYSLGAIVAQLLRGAIPPSRDQAEAGDAAAPSGRRAPFWKAASEGHSTGTSHSQVPAELQTICAHALQADPSARYDSWAQVIADLRLFLGVKRPGWLSRRGGRSSPPRKPY